ncbi:hypothetical protein ACLB2K_062960 [Fragaria x ananassa]
MVGSQPTQDTGSAPSLEQVFQMFVELKVQIHGLTTQASATQQSITNLAEQVKQDRALWTANHDKLTALNEDYGHLEGEFMETKGLVEGSLQRIRTDLDQNTKTVK